MGIPAMVGGPVDLEVEAIVEGTVYVIDANRLKKFFLK